MPKISFTKGRPSVEVEAGANLMKSLLANQVPVASSCKGQLICGKCVLHVANGAENLSPATGEERELMEVKDVPRNHRCACNASVEGDITVDAPYW
jgi:ferredoxin, 2Fe-2S